MNTTTNLTPDELLVKLKAFKFPIALKVTNEGLEPVNRPGVRLRKSILKEDVNNVDERVYRSGAYYTSWEREVDGMLSRSFATSTQIPTFWIVQTFDLNASYKTSLESTSQSKETDLFMIAQRIQKIAKVILKFEDIELTEEFHKRFSNSENREDLKKVFDDYGFFVATTCIMGGKVTAKSKETFRGEIEKNILAKKLEVYLSGNWDVTSATVENKNQNQTLSSSSSVTVEGKNQNQTLQNSVQQSILSSTTIQGGEKKIFFDDNSKWIDSITPDNWDVIQYEDLKPITDFLNPEQKEKFRKFFSNVTSINKLPKKVAEEMKWMVLRAAWYAVNIRAGEIYQLDAKADEKEFYEHSRKMSRAVYEINYLNFIKGSQGVNEANYLVLPLSQKSLDNIKWAAWNASWYVANKRAGKTYKLEAEENKKQFNDHLKSLKDSKEVTEELVESIKKMCLHAVYYTAYKRNSDTQKAEIRLNRFNYYSKIVEGDSSTIIAIS